MEFHRINNKTSNKTGIFQPTNFLYKSNEQNEDIHIAVSEGNLNKIKSLIAKKPELIESKNEFGSTPLHYAVWFGQMHIVKYLVKLGANVKTKDNYQQSLLHTAAWNGELKLVEFFLEKGLFLEDKDNRGNTPLLSAAKNDRLKVVKLLVSKGADIEAQDNQGDNIFLLATKNGYLKIIDFFAFEKKVDLSIIKDKNNNTLLHLAVLHYHDLADSNDHLKLIKYLFHFRNLNLEEKNNDGNTPLDLALETKDNDLVKNLIQLGAKIDPIKHEHYVRVHQIHQNKPEELYRYSLKQNEDLATNGISTQVSPNQKKMNRLKKSQHNFSKPQENLESDAFDMQRLNYSLNPLVNTTHFFQNPVQAYQTEVSPFNQSSISEMNHSNASQGLVLAQTLFKMPRKNNSISRQLERRKQEDHIVESINNYEFNSTVKP